MDNSVDTVDKVCTTPAEKPVWKVIHTPFTDLSTGYPQGKEPYYHSFRHDDHRGQSTPTTNKPLALKVFFNTITPATYGAQQRITVLVSGRAGRGGTPLAEDGKSQRDSPSEHKWGRTRPGRPDKEQRRLSDLLLQSGRNLRDRIENPTIFNHHVGDFPVRMHDGCVVPPEQGPDLR